MKKYLLLVIITVCIIAVFSNTTYEQQTIIPELRTVLANEPFKETLSKLEFTYWNRTISVEERGYFYFVEFLIRKTTHFFGFGIAAILFFGLYRKLKLPFAGAWAVLTIFLIASLDEYRQTFIAGRTGLFTDVLIDTAGAIFCLMLLHISLWIFRSIQKRLPKKSAAR